MKKIKLIILITIFHCSSLLSLKAADTGSDEIIPTTHKLGIGTTTPSANLHVNGTSLFTNNGNFLNKLGLGLNSPNEKLSVNGTVSFKEGSAPSISAGYGKLYTSTNSKLYFADDDGNTFNLTNGSSIAPGNYLRADTSTSYTSGTITFDTGTTMDLNSTSLSIADTDIALDGATTTFSQTGATGTITMRPKSAANFIISQNGTSQTKLINASTDAVLSLDSKTNSIIKFQENGSDMYSISFNKNGNLLKIGDQAGASTNRLVMDTNGNVSIGMPLANSKFTVNGVISIAETSTPSGSSGYGKLYALSTDKELYYLASDQSAIKLTNNGSLASGTSGATNINELTDAITDSYSIFMGTNSGANHSGNTYSTALGIEALQNNNSSASDNTAIGYRALKNNSSGINNTSFGSNSLLINTTGNDNSAFGKSSLEKNRLGSKNIAIGASSLANMANGNNNTAVGVQSGSSNSGSNNSSNGSFLGYRAGYSITTGSNNIALGYQAGDNITTGAKNIIIGNDIDAQSSTLNGQLVIGNLIFGNNINGTGTSVSTGNIGIGVVGPIEKLSIDGSLALSEIASPSSTSGFGKIYVNSADKELYFRASDVSAVKLTNNGSLSTGTSTSEWTETSLILHPADNSGAQTVVLGGTSIGGADIILHKNGSAVFNEQGLAGSDFRVESDSNQYIILADSTNNRVGIGQSNPDTVLDINGPVTVRALNNSSSGTAPNFIAFTSNGNGVGTASLTINKPSNTVENNLMVAVINIVSTNQTVTAPSGWSEINNKTASDHRSYVFYKVVGNNEASSYAFNFSGNVSSRGVILTYANGDIFSPIGAQDGITGTTGGGALYTPSVTSTKNNSTILRIGTYEDSDDTISFDNGETSRANVNYIGATGDSIRIFDKVQASAGVTGTSTDTGDSAPPSPYTGFTLAINPNASNSDPAGPDNNSAVYWLANDSGVGDNGDLLVRIRSDNTTKTFTLVDFNNDPGDQTYNGLTLNDLTANRIVRTNGSKNLTSETNIFSDTSTGNVGIGQASPSSFKLELDGGSLGPSTNDSSDIGSASKRFKRLYNKETYYTNNGGALWGSTKNNSYKKYFSLAQITNSSPKTLLDMNGNNLSYTKTYKITAHNPGASSRTGAIAYFVGNGSSSFELIKSYEQGASLDDIEFYLDSGVPKVRLYSGATTRDVQLLVEESPISGKATLAFGVSQALTSTNPGTINLRTRGAQASIFKAITNSDSLYSEFTLGGVDGSSNSVDKWGIGALGDTNTSGSNRFYIYQHKNKSDSNVQKYRMIISDNGNFHFNFPVTSVDDARGTYVFNGITAFKETSTPSSSTGFGKIFVNSSDKELYFNSSDNGNIRLTNNGFIATLDNMALDDLTDAITTSTNIYLGENSGASTPGNNYETALGINTLKSSTGADNTAVGYLTLNGNTTGYSNTAIGKWSLYANNTGFWNTAGGASALYSNTSGTYNSGFGTSALYANTTGGGNSAFGPKALFGNTTGIYNTATGIHALENITTGRYNSGLGGFALRYADNGSSNNTALGFNAGEGTSGSDFSNGTFLGYLTGNGLTTGDNNILIGFKAGDAMTSGSRNIVIGNDIDAPSNTNSNQLTIGNLIYGTGLDGTGTTLSSGNIGIGTASIDAKLEVNGAMMANTMVNKAFYTVGSATNVTVNWNNGNKQKILLETNPVNFTFTAPSAGVGSFSLLLKQDGGGSKTVTWPASVKWPGGTAPTLSTAPNKLDIVTCIYDGTDYFCQIGIDFF